MLEESIMKNISLANLKRISRHGVDPERERKRAGQKGDRGVTYPVFWTAA